MRRVSFLAGLVALGLACDDGGGAAGGAAPGDAGDTATVDGAIGADTAGDVAAPDGGPDAPADAGHADVAPEPDVVAPADAGSEDAALADAGDTWLADAGDALADAAPDPDTAPDAGDAWPEPDIADAGQPQDTADALGPEDTAEPLDTADAGPDTGPEEPPIDCAHIPQGPFELVKLDGPIASEDLAFDKEGHLIGSNDKAIFKSTYDGVKTVFVPKLNFRAGMRYLPNGHLVVCDNTKGQLVRVDEQGQLHTLITGLSYPNGIVVDMKGWVYFTEHDANKVWRVHPFTGEKALLTTKIKNPNGITFSPDYKTVYIDGFSGVGIIYAMSISEDGVPGKLIEWATGVGTGWLDGMGVDACGNVYVADYNATIIYRISPDGKKKDKIIFGSSLGAYLPNMDWGNDVGGWKRTNLYLPNGWAKEVFEVELGVPPKKRPYP